MIIHLFCSCCCYPTCNHWLVDKKSSIFIALFISSLSVLYVYIWIRIDVYISLDNHLYDFQNELGFLTWQLDNILLFFIFSYNAQLVSSIISSTSNVETILSSFKSNYDNVQNSIVKFIFNFCLCILLSLLLLYNNSWTTVNHILRNNIEGFTYYHCYPIFPSAIFFPVFFLFSFNFNSFMMFM